MKEGRAEATAVGVVLAYNYAVHRLLPSAVHVPGNLTAAAILVGLARSQGATWEETGLAPSELPSGVSLGAKVALPAAGIVAIGLLSSRAHSALTDDRIVESGRLEAAYHAAIRIPLATALGEELMFRGALPAIFNRRRSRTAADLASAVLFGVWHVLPTIEGLNSSGPSGVHPEKRARRAGAIVANVAATTLAGLGLTWLRRRSKSVAAPAIVHTAVNVTGFVIGRALGRRGSSS